jgi:hypothetical protein
MGRIDLECPDLRDRAVVPQFEPEDSAVERQGESQGISPRTFFSSLALTIVSPSSANTAIDCV